MNNPPCNTPGCKPHRALATHATRFRRGDREVLVRLEHWICDTCPDPESGIPPLIFVDHALGQENDARIKAAWEEKYQQPLPKRTPPGRKTEEPKEEKILLLLSHRELEELDSARGETSRNEYIRKAISASLQRKAS